jgi:hypothetical protein
MRQDVIVFCHIIPSGFVALLFFILHERGAADDLHPQIFLRGLPQWRPRRIEFAHLPFAFRPPHLDFGGTIAPAQFCRTARNDTE